MTKCKCSKCGQEDVHEDHKSAWMAGWDFVGGLEFCGDCSVMPLPTTKPTKESSVVCE